MTDTKRSRIVALVPLLVALAFGLDLAWLHSWVGMMGEAALVVGMGVGLAVRP